MLSNKADPAAVKQPERAFQYKVKQNSRPASRFRANPANDDYYRDFLTED